MEQKAGEAKPRRYWGLILGLCCAGALIWGGWAWWSGRCYRRAMMEIRSEMAARRFAVAATNLAKVLTWRPKSDEAAYLLGVCELERGRKPVAADAWARVAPGSVESEWALMARMRLLYDSGQISAAERFVDDALLDSRNERTGVRILLVSVYRQLGRLDDAKRLVEARWEHFNEAGEGAMEPAIRMVDLHIELAGAPPSVESARAYLDRAARQAPDDDRVWLGRANLAIRTGAHDEAKRWLDACLERRPADVPVWRARLSWGLAANRVDVVQEALKHVPAVESTPARAHRLGAWLFSQRGDVASERRELEHLVAADPADLTALDRLARLAEEAGQPARAAGYLRKKADIDRLRARYEKLHQRNQPVRDAVEMARLAEKLGREFEARAFLTLAIAENPDREDLRRELARLVQSRTTVARPGQTLADVLAHAVANHGTIDMAPPR